jgi:hypothetical protein
LQKYQWGYYQPLQFSCDLYGPVYKAMMALVKRCEEDPYHDPQLCSMLAKIGDDGRLIQLL